VRVRLAFAENSCSTAGSEAKFIDAVVVVKIVGLA
jgi:hypothetical protein